VLGLRDIAEPGMWKTRKLDELSTIRIYCKSIFQDGDHKPEILLVLHITFTAFTCRRLAMAAEKHHNHTDGGHLKNRKNVISARPFG